MQSVLLSLIIGFSAALIVSQFIIRFFAKIKNGQPILNYVESHYVKMGTPTMGGVIFLFGSLVAFLSFLQSNNRLVSICIAVMFGYGLLGFLDDFLKVKFENNQGLKAYQKAIGQLGIAILVGIFVYNSSFVGDGVIIPFSEQVVHFGWLIIPFVVFIYLAVTNSVNLTDGLDGLAGGVSVVYLFGFIGVLSVYIHDLKMLGESVIIINELTNVLVLCGGVAGAIIAFLCFNSHPAKIFMGDTGSLAIGAFIASAAVLTRLYLYIPFLGIMFVLSTTSVILQVSYYKLTKKRIFLMAPLHHHFEKKGGNETKITAIYIIITLIATTLTLIFVV